MPKSRIILLLLGLMTVVGTMIALSMCESLREMMVAIGTTLAGICAAGGIIVALHISAREHKRAMEIHTDAAVRDEKRTKQDRIALATALFSEIHHIASRCVLDGVTWANGQIGGNPRRVRHDALKFRPFQPAVYRAMAGRLMELPPNVAHLVVRFYNAVDAIDRQVSDLRENPEDYESKGGGAVWTPSRNISPNEHLKVTARFHQVLRPALHALTELRPLVQNSDELERSLRDGDSQYLADEKVLAALDLQQTPLLAEALEIRIKWFRHHDNLKGYFY